MKQFLSVFKDFCAAHPDALYKPFERCGVLLVRHQSEDDILHLSLRDPDGLFPPTDDIASAMSEFFSVGGVQIRCVAPLASFSEEYVCALLRGRLPSSAGFLRDARWEAHNDKLTITPGVRIPAELKQTLASDCLKILSGSYENLKIVDIQDSGEEVDQESLAAERETKLKALAPAPKVSKGKQKALLGQSFEAKPVPMSDITAETSKVCVVGRVFAVDSAETRAGVRLSFDITDNTGAVRVQKFFSQNGDFKDSPKVDARSVLDMVKPGDDVAVRGKMEWRRYGESEEQILRPDAIQTASIPPSRTDSAPEKRVELHLHTNMSGMDALTDPGKLLKRCAEWGHSAVAVTDHGVLHAFPEMMKARAKYFKNGDFKVLYGCEGYLVDEPAKLRGRQAFHIILFAASQVGMRNLFELTSHAHITGFHSHPNLRREDIQAHREGLLVGSACEAGELYAAIAHGEPWDKLLEICQFYDYLEIQPLCNNMFMLENRMVMDVEQLREYNRTVCRLGTATGKPVVATGDVHFLDPEDEIYRKILLDSKGMDNDRPLPLFFRTTDEMLAEFEYLGREKAYEVVVTNPNLIAQRIENLQPVRKDVFFPPHIDGSADELRHLANTRLAGLYGSAPPEHIVERIQLELEPIINGGYDVIYMTAQKLVAQSVADGYSVGSRGSVGSSIVAFLAGITEVNALAPHYRCPECLWSEFPENPLTANGGVAACGADMPQRACPLCGADTVRDGFDIPFATFLGFKADKKPDIDLNFSGEYQARAHQNTVKLFGEKSVFRAGTVATVADKTALGFVLGYMEKRGLVLSKPEIARLAKGCEGVRRSTGQHPGGLIVVPSENDINEFTPIQYPANKKSDVITTHFDYHAIEDNLLKLDLLGHDDPTMIKHLEDMTGVKTATIDLGDPAVMSLFTSSAALGFEDDKILGPTGAVAVPEFGTRFVRQMLVDTQPTTFDELVRISGLSHGTNVWIGNAAELVGAGTATLKEIICARDDIMLYLIRMGMDKLESFYIMESVRKGKGLTPEWEAHMSQHGVPAWYIQSCKKIKYMFPKAHAVAYVMSAFRIAWYKVHHPLAFYSAYFTIRADSLDAAVMLESKERLATRINDLLGIKKPSANEKDKLTMLEVCYEFKLRGYDFEPIDIFESCALEFKPTQRGLRLPFVAQPGLGRKAAENIVEKRAETPFISCDDVAARCSALDNTNLEALKKQGALRDLPDSAQLSLF